MEKRYHIYLKSSMTKNFLCSKPLPLPSSFSPLLLVAFTSSAFDDGHNSIKLTPEIAAATLRSATKTLHGSAGRAALPFVLLSVDSQASTATVRVSRKRNKSGGSYSSSLSSSSSSSLDPVAALVASLACVTRSPPLSDKTVPLALTVVRRCSSVASLASDPRSFDPRSEI